MISITIDRDQDWINKSAVRNFEKTEKSWASVIFVPITKFTTVGKYDNYARALGNFCVQFQANPGQDATDQFVDVGNGDTKQFCTRVTITDDDAATGYFRSCWLNDSSEPFG